MYTVIMAGGKGTRIASVDSSLPKPMLPVCGKPVLQMLIENLRRQGFGDIKIVTGYKAEMIEDYFGDGNRWGCNISYFREESPLGSAGALYYISEDIGEDFFLLNSDAVMDINFGRMVTFHSGHPGCADVLVHPSSHPSDSSRICANRSGKVIKWMKKGGTAYSYNNRSNAGVHILNRRLLYGLLDGSRKDLDADVLMPLTEKGLVYAYDSTEYIKDMGTPERYAAVERDVRAGVPALRALSHRQRAVFLDRDGTLNKYKGFITSAGQIELIDGAAEAVKMINEMNVLAVVITNQPVIARGECTFENMDIINGRLEALLGEKGAYIDDLFLCPHHPDKGFPGERLDLKIKCGCRKPEPGLILKAAEKYNIDLRSSYMAGDSLADLQAGVAAGCIPVYIGDELPDGAPENTLRFSDLRGFSGYLAERKEDT